MRAFAILLTILIGAQFLSNPAKAMPPEQYTLDALGVDLKTGAFTTAAQDFSIGPAGSPDEMVFTRSYNSQETGAGPLGRGWSHNFDVRAQVDHGTSQKDLFINIGMQTIRFELQNGQYVDPNNSGAKFETFIPSQKVTIWDSDEAYFRYTSRDGTTINFRHVAGGSCLFNATTGVCLFKAYQLEKPNGETITLSYNKGNSDPFSFSAGQLTSVTSSLGWSVSFLYELNEVSSNSRLSSILFASLSEHYCGNGLLSSPLSPFCHPISPEFPGLGGVDFDAQISFAYAGTNNDRLVSATDSQGNTVTYGYDSSGRLNSIRRPSSASDDRTLSYNSSGDVTSQTVNGVGTWTYDMDGTTATITDPEGNTQTAEFGTSDLPVWMEDALGRRTNFEYDSNDRLTRQENPEGDAVEFTYDARGNVTEMRQKAKPGSGLADIVTRSGFPSSCADGQEAICNKPLWTEDAKGNRTDFTYDLASSGPATITFPADDSGIRAKQSFTYQPLYAYIKNSTGGFDRAATPVHRLMSTSTCQTLANCTGGADEVKTVFDYGPQGGAGNNLSLRSVTQDPGGLNITTVLSYDELGNVLTTDGPLPGAVDTTYFRYDSQRRQVGVINADPDGSGPLLRPASRLTYNEDGQLTVTEQGTVTGTSDTAWAGFNSLQKQESIYNVEGRRASDIISAAGTTYAVQQYSYDNLGRIECVAQRLNPASFTSLPASACDQGSTGGFGADRISKSVYDAAGQLTKVLSAVGTATQQDTVTSTYTQNGQPATVMDANGNVTTYEYDGFNRLSKLRYPNKSGIGSSTSDFEQYSYDANGNVLSLRKRDGQIISFNYDALNLLIKKDLPGGSSQDIFYDYDLLGRLLSSRFGSTSGDGVINTYDKAGRVLSATSFGRTISYEYDVAGRRIRITHPDQYWASYSYDVLNRLTMVKDSTSAGAALAEFSYDDLGRRKDIEFDNGTKTGYGFDAISRLNELRQELEGSADDYTATFTYNPASQIATRSQTNDTVYAWTGHYNRDDQSTFNGQNQPEVIAEKTITHDANGNLTSDDSSTFTFDVENKLTAVSGSKSATFTYDPLGRLREVVGTATTEFLYDGSDLIAEYSASGVLLRRYVHSASVDEPLIWYEGSGTTDRRYFHADERGSIVAVTNNSGLALETRAYSPYGEPESFEGSRFQYTGQIAISEVGLYYYKARFYAPNLGRFLQTDPLGYADGLNLYAYVQGDPINLTDPMGLTAIDNIVVHGTRPSGGGFGLDNFFLDQLFRSFNDFARDAISNFVREAAFAVATAVTEQLVNDSLEQLCNSLRSAADPFREAADALLAASALSGTNPENLSVLLGVDAGFSYIGGGGATGGLILAGDGRVGAFASARVTTGIEATVGIDAAVAPTSSISGISVVASASAARVNASLIVPAGSRQQKLGASFNARISTDFKIGIPVQASVGLEVTEAFLCPN